MSLKTASKINQRNTKTYVLYHADCMDGFCAAWVVSKHMTEESQVEYIPVQYNQPIPTMKKGSIVYILDFCYPTEIIDQLIDTMTIVVIIDHHKTAEKFIKPYRKDPTKELTRLRNLYIVFDVNKSGAALTWDYFNTGKEMPEIVKYIQDRDLWKWELLLSREINAFLRSFEKHFDEFDYLSQAIIEDKERCVIEGGAILRSEQRMVEEHTKKAYETEIGGHKVLCVNATVLNSEIAGELSKGRPFGSCYSITKDGKRIYSLRSDKDGIDVAQVAELYGGGGHKHAAGFKFRY